MEGTTQRVLRRVRFFFAGRTAALCAGLAAQLLVAAQLLWRVVVGRRGAAAIQFGGEEVRSVCYDLSWPDATVPTSLFHCAVLLSHDRDKFRGSKPPSWNFLLKFFLNFLPFVQRAARQTWAFRGVECA